MLYHCWQQVINLACCSKENFAFAVLHILLYILCHSLSDTEVLHVLRNGDSHLLCQQKEIINGETRSENHGSVFQNGYLLGPEFFWCKRLNLNKGAEYNLHIMTFCYIIVGRVSRDGLGLRDKYLLYHRCVVVFS